MQKIIHGDCLEELKKIQSKFDLVLTDPPYFVIPKGKNSFGKEYSFNWDNFKNLEEIEDFTKDWFQLASERIDQGFIIIFWSQKYFNLGVEIFNPDRILLWHYNNLILGGNGDFAYDYDPIFLIKKGNPKIIEGKHSCILEYTKPQSNFKKDTLLHPTQKPLELFKHLIRITNSKEILDPFAGGGTTALASKILGRNSTSIEKELKYIKIIKERLEQHQKNLGLLGLDKSDITLINQ